MVMSARLQVTIFYFTYGLDLIFGHVHETLKVLTYCQSDFSLEKKLAKKLSKQTDIATTTQTYFV